MEIFKEKILLILIILSGVLLLLSCVLVAFRATSLPTPTVIHFDAFRGVDILGSPIDVWGIWVFGACAIFINLYLAHIFFFRERFLSYMLIGGNVLLSLFVLIITSLIISVN